MILNPMVGNSLQESLGLVGQSDIIMNQNKLYVGNLSFQSTENGIMDTFAEHGTVLEVNLITDRDTGRMRGFGFVTMSSDEEAQKAAEAMNGVELDGRQLTVNIAKPREERGGGGGRGGRNRY